jgi:hypothetical protein
MSGGPRTGFVLPTDPLNELGDPADVFRGPAQTFMRTLINVIRLQFAKFVNRETATPYFHLSSPNGTTYRVSVDDAGALKVENARAIQISQT